MTYDPLGIDYMCPFCVTPWKCNGPHILVDEMLNFQTYMDDVAADVLTEAIQAVYKDCGHTKYVGCRPCIHDEIADRVRGVEDAQRQALRELVREAQAMGLPDGPPPATR